MACVGLGLVRAPAQVVAGAQESAVSVTAYSPMRRYYLAQDTYDGSQPVDACAGGYHMASLWEIADPSALRYDSALGYNRSDVGAGPPSFIEGWVRTGYNSDSGTVPGQANCAAWSATSGYGTVVGLPADWSGTGQDIGVWDAAFRTCASTAGVWCVADAVGSGTCLDPLVLSCGQTIQGDTSGFVNYVSAYDCSAWNESGPETLYRFDLAPGGLYTVTAQISGMTVDLDVFLLAPDGCSGGQCAATSASGDAATTVGALLPGAYYVSVDGFNGAAGSYTLELSCSLNDTGRIFLPLALKEYGP